MKNNHIDRVCKQTTQESKIEYGNIQGNERLGMLLNSLLKIKLHRIRTLLLLLYEQSQ